MRTRLALVLLLLAGCSDSTALLLEVQGQGLSAPGDIDTLRFVVESDTGTMFDQAYPLLSLPQSLTILPASDADRDVTITVEGTSGGILVIRRVLRSAFEPGSTVRVPIFLTGDCLGVVCPEGVDCAAGRCSQPPADAGPGDDGGVDAGPPPGVDAGPGMDAGDIDGGFDGGFDGGTDAGGMPVLFFSEYVEGTSNNKALEIVNVGDAPEDLSNCVIRRYTNGASMGTTIPLMGTIAANGGVWTICNSLAMVGSGRCDVMNGFINHNGDDAYELECNFMVLDTFGQIGTDPGTEWSGGGLGTQDYVLQRNCTVMAGDTNGADAFDPSAQWTGMAYSNPTASHTGLGNRTECP